MECHCCYYSREKRTKETYCLPVQNPAEHHLSRTGPVLKQQLWGQQSFCLILHWLTVLEFREQDFAGYMTLYSFLARLCRSSSATDHSLLQEPVGVGN